jgi:tetratricopeptide (TPR) repeat protein
VAARLDNLANLVANQGRYAEAQPLYERALTIPERALALNHPELAPTLVGLASVRKDQWRNIDAVALLERALVIKEHAYTAARGTSRTPLLVFSASACDRRNAPASRNESRMPLSVASGLAL